MEAAQDTQMEDVSETQIHQSNIMRAEEEDLDEM
jgi:hypothetical protein